ncbi:hypothetical protein BH24ACT5_BH24ACT5_26990 [soil metagenome]
MPSPRCGFRFRYASQVGSSRAHGHCAPVLFERARIERRRPRSGAVRRTPGRRHRSGVGQGMTKGSRRIAGQEKNRPPGADDGDHRHERGRTRPPRSDGVESQRPPHRPHLHLPTELGRPRMGRRTRRGHRHSRHPQGMPVWSVWTHPIIGGEPDEAVGDRADAVIELAMKAPGDTVLFAHGHLLRILAARWLGLPATAGCHLALNNATVSTLGYEREPCHPTLERRLSPPPYRTDALMELSTVDIGIDGPDIGRHRQRVGISMTNNERWSPTTREGRARPDGPRLHLDPSAMCTHHRTHHLRSPGVVSCL